MYIGCIPNKKIGQSAKSVIVESQRPCWESIVRGIVLTPFCSHEFYLSWIETIRVRLYRQFYFFAIISLPVTAVTAGLEPLTLWWSGECSTTVLPLLTLTFLFNLVPNVIKLFQAQKLVRLRVLNSWEPYSQHLIFFVTFECSNTLECLLLADFSKSIS